MKQINKATSTKCQNTADGKHLVLAYEINQGNVSYNLKISVRKLNNDEIYSLSRATNDALEALPYVQYNCKNKNDLIEKLNESSNNPAIKASLAKIGNSIENNCLLFLAQQQKQSPNHSKIPNEVLTLEKFYQEIRNWGRSSR